MPELPEISNRAREMQAALVGKTITSITVIQPKSLNVPESEFKSALEGAIIQSVSCHGKWIFTETSGGWLLLNLGMGGEILLVPADNLPEKRRLVFTFDDRTALSVNFWWFGYAHYASPDGLTGHAMTSKLGPNATEVTADQLWDMIKTRRGRVKDFLLDQSNLSGIGNAYVHDILFLARLHPLQPLPSLTQDDVNRLSLAIQDGLQPSIAKGGAFYELSIYGEKGGFLFEDLLVAYKEGKSCPECGEVIVKLKTGSTSGFICPNHQALR
jgi:formamidopyrimidine-DNA glycosylase